MKSRILLILTAFFFCWPAAVTPAATNFVSLRYMPAPVNNPLKGFIPKQGDYRTFPYSMEWAYLPLRPLMTGPTNFNWTALDSVLRDIAGRGHQTALRIYLDYPARTTGIPQYLLDAGLMTHSYTDYGNASCTNNSNPGHCAGSVSPDYSDPNLQQALTNFIAAFGARYDGDPRIGFITIGLLGYWGEWHTYPETQWFASTAVQNEVLSAYQAAFTRTKLQVRYANSITVPYPFGYHDDSFGYDTLPSVSFSFYGDMVSAGDTNKWLTQPIGGEVRPEVQACMWNASSNCAPAGQGYSNCVTTTHASWMLCQYLFSPGLSGPQQAAALAGAHALGYELYVTSAILADAAVSGPLNVSVVITNTGVAPFYYNWPVQLRVLNSSQQAVQTWTTSWQLAVVPPGNHLTWNFAQTNHGLAAGQYKLLLGVPGPMTNGPLFRFANQTQDADFSGWITLGTFSVVANPAPPQLSAASATTTNGFRD